MWAVFAALWSWCTAQSPGGDVCVCVCVSYRLSRDWSNHLWRKQPFLTLYMPDTCSPPSHGPNCSDPASELTSSALIIEPDMRFSIADIKGHSCGIWLSKTSRHERARSFWLANHLWLWNKKLSFSGMTQMTSPLYYTELFSAHIYLKNLDMMYTYIYIYINFINYMYLYNESISTAEIQEHM